MKIDKRLGPDLTGLVVGKLTVLSVSHRDVRRNQYWNCICECGNTTVLSRGNLRGTGATQSCGCLRYTHDAAVKRLFQIYKNNAKRRKHSWDLTEEQFKAITSSPCHYTGKLPSMRLDRARDFYVYNGIDRLDSSKGYTVENCVPCCSEVNYAKRIMSYSDFIQLCKEVTQHMTQENKCSLSKRQRN
jgi:hypothetical protein